MAPQRMPPPRHRRRPPAKKRAPAGAPAAPTALAAKAVKTSASKKAPAPPAEASSASRRRQPSPSARSSARRQEEARKKEGVGAREATHADASAVKSYLNDLHDRITAAVEAIDGAKFRRDPWTRPEGGGGESRILSDGAVFERAGVSVLPCVRRQDAAFRLELSARKLPARPSRPWDCPWCFIREILTPPPRIAMSAFSSPRRSTGPCSWWFGGGFDLTPYYPYDEDVLHWHRTARDACQPFGAEAYGQYKAWCDRYFFLPHRNETRGVGGLFFDDFNHGGFSGCFRACSAAWAITFCPPSCPSWNGARIRPYGDRERQFQLYRRGRYVEFNLVYDRGTLFGLQSRGRTESILMSLPPVGPMGLRLASRPGFARGETVRGFSASAGLPRGAWAQYSGRPLDDGAAAHRHSRHREHRAQFRPGRERVPARHRERRRQPRRRQGRGVRPRLRHCAAFRLLRGAARRPRYRRRLHPAAEQPARTHGR